MTLKEELRQLVEELPEEQAVEAAEYLRRLQSVKAPLSRSPLDDPGLTPEKAQAMSGEEFRELLEAMSTRSRAGYPPLSDADISRDTIYD